jgi:hypothetical protein
MKNLDHRPANGSGSCARCLESLGLASLKFEGVWYCGTACLEGRSAADSNPAQVPESWLYARPRRFFRKRMPKELRSGGGSSNRS